MGYKYGFSYFQWAIQCPEFQTYKRGGKGIRRYRDYKEHVDGFRLVRKQMFRHYWEFPKFPKRRFRRHNAGFCR